MKAEGARRASGPGARTLVGAFGVGIAFIALCSVATLFYLAQLNAVASHLARDPVPGAAAIAGFAKDFNQYLAIEEGPATGDARDQTLVAKAADIARDLHAYDITITQDDDRREFGKLTALWTDYASLHHEPDAMRAADMIDARLATMIEWNRLEGVRSIESADTARRNASVTVLSMLVAAIFLSGLAFYFHLALDESREQMQRLAAGLLQAREEERTAIAREIHDTLGQTLTALKMDVSWISRRVPDGAPAVGDKLGAMVTLIDDTVVTVRRMATDLRPGVLDDLGLAAAVEWQAQDFERRTGIACGYRAALDDAALDPLLSTAVFRIFQESLTNVARHSRASVVAVALERRGADLVLEVRDDGVGISAADASNSRSIGLTGMRERAQLVGGGVAFTGAPGAGTTVRVRIPWRAKVRA